MKFLILILFLPAIMVASKLPSIPDMLPKPVEFTVLDPEGVPVEGALVEASRAGPGNSTGITDSSGKLRIDLNSGATLYVHVSKDGYYTTSGELWRGGIRKGPEGKLVARVLPGSFEIVLKPVLEPVALRHKKFRGIAPVVDAPAGFDFQVGDWVSPHGKGVTTDLYFHFHDIENGPEGYSGTMTINFPNRGDGIQPFQAARPFSTEFGSNLAPPNRAPVDGYEPILTATESHREGTPYPPAPPPGRNYLFRTRTILDPQGTIRQACYGWFEGEITFDPRDPRGPQLSFTYFFNHNPDPEARSLEYILHVPKKQP